MGPHLVDSPILCLGISFVPKETGEHLVHVKKNGQHVASSPIPVVISQSEIGDASRVRVSGQGLREGHTFEPAEFIIDTRDAGRQWWSASWGNTASFPWHSGLWLLSISQAMVGLVCPLRALAK